MGSRPMKADIEKLISNLENIPCDIDSMIVTIGNSQDKDEWGDILNTPENMKKERLMEALDQVQIYWDSSLHDAFAEMEEPSVQEALVQLENFRS